VFVVYVVLLMALPSQLIVAPLGAAGTPAGILAIGCMFWWVVSKVTAPWGSGFSSPVKWLLGAFAATLLVSYAVGASRAVSSAIEVSSADRALLGLCAWCGLALVVIDGVGTRRGLDKVLGTAVAGAGLIALLGMLQYFFNLDIANIIRIPGLTANGVFGEVISRSAFRRVTGTTTHPIEFGVVLSALLPLCVHYARFAKQKWARVASWGVVLGVAGALPLAVARSGILGFAIVFMLMYPTWPVRLRRRIGVGLVVGVMAFSVVVPGLLGTIRSLFVNATSDPSTAGRTEDYGPALAYVQQRPFFGRGLGTFMPELYRTLDNQYLGIVIEAGIVGLAATLALFLGSMLVAGRSRRRMSSDEDRDLAQSLVAGLAVFAVSAATFDLFAFSMAVGVMFLLIGGVGSLVALVTPARAPTLRRYSPRALSIAGVATLAMVLGLMGIHTLERPSFQAVGTVVWEPPARSGTPALSSVDQSSAASLILYGIMETPMIKEDLKSQGVPDYDVAQGDGSLMMGTDRQGSGSLMRILVRASDPTTARKSLALVMTRAERELTRVQLDAGSPPGELIRARVISVSPPVQVSGHPSRFLAATGLLGVFTFSCALYVAAGRRKVNRSALRTSRRSENAMVS
jgi:O-antigen ligase